MENEEYGKRNQTGRLLMPKDAFLGEKSFLLAEMKPCQGYSKDYMNVNNKIKK